MIRIYNPKLKIEPTPLESLGALTCQIYDPALPQYRALLGKINYGGRSVVSASLVTTDGFVAINMPEFSQVQYVEIGGSLYTEAEDYTALLPGEYVYNSFTETLTIRVY